ncbi:MAG: FG-GAP-like repeat-containing protein, partial [Planctomycetota bacterium]|nr:FG-GAP-like repeat-containing protein [Planctomycetota bacterium]
LMFFMGGSAGPSSEPTRVEALPEPLADEEQEVQLHLRDVNGDGRVDVVAVTAAQAEGLSNRVFRVLVYHAGAQGLFGEQPAQVLRFEAGGLEAQVVDVDDDGHMDLAIEKIELPSLVGAVTGIEVKFSHLVFPGGARGIARKPLLSYEERHDEDSAIDLAVSRTLSHDCDGDGMADVVAIDLAGEITIRRVRAQESRLRGATWKLDPAPWKRFDVGGSIESLRVADYNGDGLGDIVSAGEDRLTVLLSVRQGRGR